jgi:hypothetical protein
MIARRDPDSGRVTLSLEVELKTTRNPRGRDERMRHRIWLWFLEGLGRTLGYFTPTPEEGEAP